MNNHEFTCDILKELFNISVGKAADMLSEIINKKIILSVPNLVLFNKANNQLKIKDYLSKTLDGTLMVSSLSFENNLSGKANLIFPADKMRTFIDLCLGNGEEHNETNFTDVDFDIIKEVGNIVLNCILGEVGNFLSLNLSYVLPEVKVYNGIDFNKDIENNEYQHLLLLYITFLIDGTEIEGAIIIDLTMNSLNDLLDKINKLKDEL